MKKFIATNCELTLHEDDWCTGEGKLIDRWNIKLNEADTIAGVLEDLRHEYLDKNFKDIKRVQDVFDHDPCYDDEPNRFDADLIVDIEDDGNDGFRIIKPTEEKWKQFENGKVKLYALHVIVHIQMLSDLDIDDICDEGWCR